MDQADRSMAGKTCVVTGATGGIGLAIARGLARRGATVVLVGRSRERGEQAVATIRRDTGNTAVEFLATDLSSQAAIRRLVEDFQARHSRLHVLINNAGAIFAYREESADGIEMSLALNHLGYFLLTTLLLDTLKASVPARIINMASHAHERIKAFDFDNPQARNGGRWGYGQSSLGNLFYTLLAPMHHPALLQYSKTKLANLLFTYELARRLEGTGITVNAVDPGFVASDFMAGNGALGCFMRFWARLLGRSVERGAETPIYLATAPEVAGITGKHFHDCRQAATSPASMDEAAARRLWTLSEALTGTRTQLAPSS